MRKIVYFQVQYTYHACAGTWSIFVITAKTVASCSQAFPGLQFLTCLAKTFWLALTKLSSNYLVLLCQTFLWCRMSPYSLIQYIMVVMESCFVQCPHQSKQFMCKLCHSNGRRHTQRCLSRTAFTQAQQLQKTLKSQIANFFFLLVFPPKKTLNLI